MKFALFEFIASDDVAGNSLSIGESSWIVDLEEDWANNDSFDFNEEIQVEWPGDKHKRGEIFTARVHRFSDDKKELNDLLQSMVDSDNEDVSTSSRGRRRKVRKIESDSEHVDKAKEQTKTAGKKDVQKCLSKKSSAKKSEQSLLAKLDKQLAEKELAPSTKTAVFEPLNNESGKDVMLATVQEQNVKLRKENAWLKSQVLASLKVFPSLIDKLTNEVDYRARSGVSSPCSSSSGIPSTPEPVIKVIDQGQSANKEVDRSELIPYDVVASCKSTDSRKMTNNLLKTVFGTEYLGTHSLTGSAGAKNTPAKPALDAKKVAAILDAVLKTFNNESERTIRHYITDYLNNCAKSLRAITSKPAA